MKTNRLIILGTLATVFAQSGFALSQGDSSRFQTDENGFAKAPAEFSGFTVHAITHCDPSATQANKSIRELSGQIEEVLKRFADATVEEGIQSFPGATTKGDLIQHQNGVSVTICKGWNGTQSYFFKLARLSDIPAFQDAVLELNPATDPKRVVSLSAPRPGIFSKTYERLVDLALRNAHEKAVRRVKVLLEDMPQFSQFLLSKVMSSTTAAGSVAYDQTGLGGDPSLSVLSSVNVNITRSFQFDLK